MTIDIQQAVLDIAQELQDLLDAVLPRPDEVPEHDRRVQGLFTDPRCAVEP